ncbi:MAG: response regulator [Flavobacteriales bacterium]|nr:response regulator [Flavobacteriales bacterium]
MGKPSKKLNLLLVEDNAFVSFILENKVRNTMDINVFQFSSVKACITNLRKSPDIDILVIDYHLGDGTAIDILKRLKIGSCRTIVMTGHPEPEMEAELAKFNVKDFIIKRPNTGADLVEALQFNVRKIKKERNSQPLSKKFLENWWPIPENWHSAKPAN